MLGCCSCRGHADPSLRACNGGGVPLRGGAVGQCDCGLCIPAAGGPALPQPGAALRRRTTESAVTEMAAALLLGSLAVVGVRGQMDACDTAGLM